MKRGNGRNQGEVFTDKNAIQFILDEVDYSPEVDLRSISILEPASGKGAFAIEIINRLFQSSLLYNFSFLDSLICNLTFVELDNYSFGKLCSSIDELVFDLTHQKTTVSSKICLNTNFLTHEFNMKYDAPIPASKFPSP